MMPSPDVVVLHPPVLPYGYTLHHRFQRIWEMSEYIASLGVSVQVIDAGLLNMLQGQILERIPRHPFTLALYLEPQMIDVCHELLIRMRAISPLLTLFCYGPACLTHPDSVRSLAPEGVSATGDYEFQLASFIAAKNPDLIPEHVLREQVDTHGYLNPEAWAYPPLEMMPMSDIARIYSMKGDPTTIALSVARGCPYPCAFCSTPAVEGKRDRRRPIGSLIDYLKRHADVEHWQFYAPTFTLNRRWCLDFFDALDVEGLRINWRCTTRADRLDPALLERMAIAGCEGVGIGVETFGPAAKLIDKHVDFEVLGEVLRQSRDLGLKTKCYIMMGLPEQTPSDVRSTIEWVKDQGATPRLTMYSPQGDVDTLVRRGLIARAQPSATLDRKVHISESPFDADFIRLLYER